MRIQTIEAAFMAIAALAQPALAQQKTVVSLDPKRAPDSLTFRKLVTIPDSSERMGRGMPFIIRDRRGNHYTYRLYESTLFMYDSAGRFVKRIGRHGEGPGEYQSILAAYVGPGDSLRIFSAGRHTVLPPRTHKVVRTTPMPVLLLPEGTTLVGNSVVNNNRSRFRAANRLKKDDPGQGGADELVVFNSSGAMVRAFGSRLPPDYVYRPDDTDYPWQRGTLCASGTNAVWTFTRGGFERWSLTGKLLSTVFRAKDARTSAWRKDDPASRGASNCYQSANGNLWILSRVPTGATKQVDGLLVEGGKPRSAMVPVYDGILEIFDVTRGTIVASQRVGPEMFIGGFLMGDAVFTWRETEEGELFIDVWTVERTPRAP